MIPQSSYSLERSLMHGWLQNSMVVVVYEGKSYVEPPLTLCVVNRVRQYLM